SSDLEICMAVLSPQQVMGSRCTPGVTHDWLGYKSPDQMAVGERWSSCLDRDWFWSVVGFGVSLVLQCRCFWSVVGFGVSLVVDYRWLWIIVVVVYLYYHLPDCTSHLLFLFITLIFTTRLLRSEEHT